MAAVTSGASGATWEQPSEVLAAGTGPLPTDLLALEGWQHDGGDAGVVAGGPVGGVGSGVWGDVAGAEAWGDASTWPEGVAGEYPYGEYPYGEYPYGDYPYGDPFGGTYDDPYTIPGYEEPLASAYPAGLGQGDIPEPTVRAYRAAAAVLAREEPGCGIDWALLAGIGRVESNHGRFGGAVVTTAGTSVPGIYGPRLDGSLAGTMVIRDTDGGALDADPVYDRAVGPMQFIPGTWARWGSDGDRDGVRNPQDIDDAALAAARYLCAGGADIGGAGASAAVRRYNNSTEYVNLVLSTAAGYRDGDVTTVPGGTAPVYGQPGPPGWVPPSVVYPGGPVGDGGTTTPGTATPGTATPGTATPGRPPSTQPPREPTTRPTTQPTRPTTAPTTQPPRTTDPTVRPTTRPTTTRPTRPTTAPTAPPSGEPTAPPSGQPTGTPSGQPTGGPSGQPTGAPSGEPTGAPSGEPTAVPSSGAPSSSAPASPAPSGTTSVAPTGAPGGPATAPVCDPDVVLDEATGTVVDAETGEPVDGAVPCEPGPTGAAAADVEPSREP
ncbi:lytic murein transglycosylase [Aquipuribacter sp. SD81]|uniref:lytic murein transglycosylase n=1 Tax=Aquipuribacter sp. SD81 TaxID=3127703 RepID=UPI0030187090